jgi:glycerol-3-phosphate O-acyltransferase
LVEDWIPIEFFIEGKRSRIGRCIQPKYGLLSIMLEPWFEGKVPDLTFLPLSITYERLLEAEGHARELLGHPKEKESLANLLRASRVVLDRYGDVNLACASPISSRVFLEQMSKVKGADFDPKGNPSHRKMFVEALGSTIVSRVQRSQVQPCTALVSALILAYRTGITYPF